MTDTPKPLTFEEVIAASIPRANIWHGGDFKNWSVADWAVAFGGEAGEVLNAVKKLRRIEDHAPNVNDPERQLSTRAAAVAKIGDELADTFLYMVLLAARENIDLPAAIIRKFNETSVRYGFPQRLRPETP